MVEVCEQNGVAGDRAERASKKTNDDAGGGGVPRRGFVRRGGDLSGRGIQSAYSETSLSRCVEDRDDAAKIVPRFSTSPLAATTA